MVKKIIDAFSRKNEKKADAESKTPAKKRVKFEVAAGIGKTVSVAGSFNEWDPNVKYLTDKDGDGVYVGYLMLPPGRYEYKLVIDGKWYIDESNPNFLPNDFGSLNSVIDVK